MCGDYRQVLAFPSRSEPAKKGPLRGPHTVVSMAARAFRRRVGCACVPHPYAIIDQPKQPRTASYGQPPANGREGRFYGLRTRTIISEHALSPESVLPSMSGTC